MVHEIENDLPLVANVEDILVRHYMFSFSCCFDKKIISSTAVLFLEPVAYNNASSACECPVESFDEPNNSRTDSPNSPTPKHHFVVVLDCHKIRVCSIDEVTINSDSDSVKYKGIDPKSLGSKGKLKYSIEKWSLKIWKDGCFCKFCFPKAIRIDYATMPEGSSLLWAKDQEQKPAVFTCGSYLNNRSLFPCQEPPSAMATWEAKLDVEDPAIALMSGDEDAKIHSVNGRTHYYYFTRNILPLSTLCLAVGFWEEHIISTKMRCGPKCRIFSPPSLLNKAIEELFEYVPCCLSIAEDILGPYPFPRIDFLIVPPTFGSLGMASPNIIFLSQSLLSGDSSMSSRVAHEIVHGWFGLLIGALDWTEEWLSEGFATFVEDHLHVKTMNMPEKVAEDYIQVKAHIKLTILLHEISNSDQDLQLLKGKIAKENVDGVSAFILKHGQNPQRAFMQVHYIKGFFLLKYLAEMVGVSDFFKFLNGYIDKYKGRLVTSAEFLTFFFDWFPQVRSQATMEQIQNDWFYNPDVIPELKKAELPPENSFFSAASAATRKCQTINKAHLSQKYKRKKYNLDLQSLPPEAMILFLENLLEEDKMSKLTLSLLSSEYKFSTANHEVQHRWFELVVKYQYAPMYQELKTFLVDHLAGGVYLFNEMLFSKATKLQKIAKEVYFSLKPYMEPNYIVAIEDMLKNSAK